MYGGTIRNNTASSGGAVFLGKDSTNTYPEYPLFVMEGGTISGNTADEGGGVYVDTGTFTLRGGTISGNTVFYNGGGVCVGGGAFDMRGGTISGNTASGEHQGGILDGAGGGVYVDGDGVFTKTDGTIYGSNGGNRKNTAELYGQAVYVVERKENPLNGTEYRAIKERNTTAGPGVNLDSEGINNWEIINP